MGNKKSFILFFVGIAVALILVFSLRKCSGITEEKVQNDYYILTNQISKMNKMVVIEQDFSNLQKTKITNQLFGIKGLPSSEKEIVIFTKAKAQVTYDLKKMKIEVDSVDKKLIIKEIPNADIKIFTDAEITSLDDSFFDRFSEEDFKRITNNARKNAEKTVDQTKLRNEGRKQLMTNLNEIFVLAKALNYEIVDETQSFDLSKF